MMSYLLSRDSYHYKTYWQTIKRGENRMEACDMSFLILGIIAGHYIMDLVNIKREMKRVLKDGRD